MTTPYPKRLIEVDLPIKKISEHARREKSIRHGHISTLHIWWARRPLAACRAVICASLWPDPADALCPQAFRDAAARLITDFARRATTESTLSQGCAPDTWARWKSMANPKVPPIDTQNEDHLNVLRYALLDFIADFANWDNSTNDHYLETSRDLTQAAHEALGGETGTKPLVVDPFAGGGAIPLEALRVGADAFASDLNPVAVLLNKVVLEYIPKYGQELADEVRQWGAWIKEQAERELSEFYPKDPDGATPIAYLWARTVVCEAPGCGAQVPLMRSLWLAKKASNSIALKIVPNPKGKRVDFDIIQNAKAKEVGEGTVRRGAASCPCCGYTTPVASVRRQLKARRGGAADARLFCVVTTRPGQQGRFYRLPVERDLHAVGKAAQELEKRKAEYSRALSLVPDEPTPTNDGHRAVGSPYIYGMTTWGDLFSPRQLLALTTLARLVREAGDLLAENQKDNGLAAAVQTGLSISLSKETDLTNALTRWKPDAECPVNLFARQAIPMVWEYAETVSTSQSSGSWASMYERTAYAVSLANFDVECALNVTQNSATSHPFPDDAAHAFVTDPPYYDSVPYSDLSDFFYVWLKRTLPSSLNSTFSDELTPRNEQAVVWHPNSIEERLEYEKKMMQAMAEGRRVLAPSGIGVVVFAHKSTSGWETLLQAMIDAGWTITGSWPIDTEMGTRMNAMGTAALASSVHLVCRPRENTDGSVRADDIGDWRDVLQELPQRIHEWMPRLATEGVVGADAIFACLGPALEIFSRYSSVEKPNGEEVSLREYLEYVWAAVAKEAISVIFAEADATGLEPDARLTAMWLWTLTGGAASDGAQTGDSGVDEESEDDEGSRGKKAKLSGYSLEFDAARKIAQGLGAHLEDLPHVVQTQGSTARLLSVSERTRYLFGKDEAMSPTAKRPKKSPQLSMFAELEQADEETANWGQKSAPRLGTTTLDRVHQAMILFAAGRADALKTFLVDEGAGNDARFWKLAQSLSALYPTNTDEKRWVDGVLARKRGLGF